jgi:hypothetical protein
MPWRGKQAQAIFLKKKRELGEAGARRFMREHGNVSARTEAIRRESRRKKTRH